MTCCTIANILSRIDFAAFATVIMALFTGCLVVCNIYLWRSTEKAAEAAKKSANSLTAIERAYIYVSISADMKSWQEVNTKNIIPAKIIVYNRGKTAAILKNIITEIKIITKNKCAEERPINYESDFTSEACGCIIEGNSHKIFDVTISVASIIHEWDILGKGDACIIFFGRVEYQDIFKNAFIAHYEWQFYSWEQTKGFHIINPEGNYIEEKNE